jgi:hypothetical protein
MKIGGFSVICARKKAQLLYGIQQIDCGIGNVRII